MPKQQRSAPRQRVGGVTSRVMDAAGNVVGEGPTGGSPFIQGLNDPRLRFPTPGLGLPESRTQEPDMEMSPGWSSPGAGAIPMSHRRPQVDADMRFESPYFSPRRSRGAAQMPGLARVLQMLFGGSYA